MKSYLASKFNRLVLSLLFLVSAVVVAVSCTSGAPRSAPLSAMCSPGLTDCGNNDCRDLANDPSSCGACGNVCSGVGSLCAGGACTCQAGLSNCNGACIETISDPANCGGCGIVCGAEAPFCSQGACAASCAAGLMACGNACVDTNTSVANCGACGAACGAGQSCSGGGCTCATANQISCGGMCVDTQTNTANCGGCGVVCAAGQVCSAGACQGGSASGVGGATASTTTDASTTTTNPSTTTDASTTTSGGGASSTTSASTTGNTGDAPPGWWTYGDWAGCVWTGIDTVEGTTTTVNPQDFTSHTAGESYCVSGQVHDNYDSVALLGFNLAEPIAAADCTYNPASAMEVGPPEVALSGQGLAVNFTKVNASTTLRVQVQGSNGAIDANNRWCATINAVSGKAFVPWGDFNTECWEGGNGTAFNPSTPISAVVFLVPGVAPGSGAEPYEYCIHGFATGSSADDAPDGGEQGSLSGEIGGPGSDDVDFQRVKIIKDGEEYIIQNNNWGNPGGSDQLISYVDNSFTVVSSTGVGQGAAVASFPSIYIGANGDTQGTTYSTVNTDGLPAQLSGINSVMSTFRWSGGNGGQYNVTYDIWFASSPPNYEYEDGISGFVMLWLFDPSGSQPIGSVQRTANLAGRTWDVWVGPRGGGGPNNNAPVVSYVSQGTVNELSNIDLMTFIRDAEQNGINQSWYLTDVFGGFEIWTGPDANGLKMEEFTAVVQ